MFPKHPLVGCIFKKCFCVVSMKRRREEWKGERRRGRGRREGRGSILKTLVLLHIYDRAS